MRSRRSAIPRRVLDYPGVGRGTCWTIGHPESVTLPRTYPTLRASNNVMLASMTSVPGIKILAGLIDLGVLSVERAAWLAERAEGSSARNISNEMVLVTRSGDA